MNVIDISWPIKPGMTTYKDNKPISFTQHKNFPTDGVRDASVTMNCHTGTHIDAPAHFLADGKTIEHTPLASVIGQALVLDLPHVFDCITATDLAAVPLTTKQIILFKTNNSLLPVDDMFEPNFVYLAADAARLLADSGVKAVGIDYLGIERNQPAHDTHEILLRHGVIIIEGLRLGHVAAGTYQLVCLPLALQGLEAAPARAVLLQP